MTPEDIRNGAVQAGGLLNETFGRVVALACMRTVTELGLFDIIPIDGETTTDDISSATGASPDLVMRLLRPLTAIKIFEEAGPRAYRHTPMSVALKDPRLRGYFQLGWDMWLPVYGSQHNWYRDHKFQPPRQVDDCPFSAIHGDPLFVHLGKNPEKAALFNASMEHMAYPAGGYFPMDTEISWADGDRLVDVGGGKGQATRELVDAHPVLAGKIVLQDQADVLANVPQDVRDVAELISYNFFQEQPVKDAKVYYLRNILCDWPDEACVEILKNQAAAMGESSRLLISALIVPEQNVDSVTAAMDACMVTYGGSERTEAQFAQLLSTAGLQLHRTWRKDGIAHGVVEARLKG